MYPRLAGLAFVLFAPILAAQESRPGGSEEWLQPLGSAEKNTWRPAGRPIRHPEVLWHLGGVRGVPAIAGGYAYVGGRCLAKVDLKTGAVVASLPGGGGPTLWTRPKNWEIEEMASQGWGSPWFEGSPLIAEDRVLALKDNGNLLALDLDLEKIAWDFRLPRPASRTRNQPVHADGVVVVAAGHLFGIDLEQGNQLWVSPAATPQGWQAPALWRGTVISATTCGRLQALDLKSGETLWSKEHGLRFALPVHPPLVADGRILLFSLDPPDGLELWQLKGALHSFDATSGALLWSRELRSLPLSRPIADETWVYVLFEDWLARFDQATGKEDQDFRLHTGSAPVDPPCTPVILGTYFYFATVTGPFEAIDLARRKTAWRFFPEREGYWATVDHFANESYSTPPLVLDFAFLDTGIALLRTTRGLFALGEGTAAEPGPAFARFWTPASVKGKVIAVEPRGTESTSEEGERELIRCTLESQDSRIDLLAAGPVFKEWLVLSLETGLGVQVDYRTELGEFGSENRVLRIVPLDAPRAAPAKWPQHRGSADHDNARPLARPIRRPKVLWHLPGVGTLPAVADGHAYAGFWRLVKIDLETGSVRASIEPSGMDPHDCFSGPPLIAGRRVVIGRSPGRLQAFDLDLKEIHWEVDLGVSRLRVGPRCPPHPPNSVDGVVVAALDRVFGIDLETGAFLWRTESLDGSVRMTPAIWNKTVFFATTSGSVYALALNTGEQIWKCTLNCTFGGKPPVVAQGHLFLAGDPAPGGGTGFFGALDPTTGELLWSHEAGVRSYPAPSVTADSAYTRYRGSMAAYDPRTGEMQHTYDFAERAADQGSPMVIGSKLVYPTSKGHLDAVDLQTGLLSWRFAPRKSDSDPIRVHDFALLDSGLLLVLTEWGLFALGEDTKLPEPGYTLDWLPPTETVKGTVIRIEVRENDLTRYTLETEDGGRIILTATGPSVPELKKSWRAGSRVLVDYQMWIEESTKGEGIARILKVKVLD